LKYEKNIFIGNNVVKHDSIIGARDIRKCEDYQ